MTIQAKKLQATLATLESIEPYGQLISTDRDVSNHIGDFYEGAVRVHDPISFSSDDDTCLSLTSVDPRPLEVTYLERHFKHTQTFIPLGGKPYMVVLGAPTSGDLPEIESVRAFRFPGNTGLCMHIGTWHEFPFALENSTEMLVILRNETTRNLSGDNVVDGEAHGGDLDKKNILKRIGISLEVSL
jgi:ureidoglycolate lyase